MKIKNVLSVTSLMFISLSCSFCTVVASNEEKANPRDTISVASQAHTKQEVHDFVTHVGNEIIRILVEKDKPIIKRKTAFKEFLLKYFDMHAIGEFVIGQYWKKMSDTQRSEYINLFKQAVVENYAAKFNDYSNQKLEVKKVTDDAQSKHSRVFSNIIKPNGKVFHKIEWVIGETENGLRVLDIRIEGISMRLTMRTDYKGVYRRGGYAELKEYLDSKINNVVEQSLTEQ